MPRMDTDSSCLLSDHFYNLPSSHLDRKSSVSSIYFFIALLLMLSRPSDESLRK